MPRIVHCDTEGCPLKTALGFTAKFCQDCGKSSSDVVEVIKPKCVSCAAELSETARFCPECGTKVERDMVKELLKDHERPGEVTTGRGLTADEMHAIEASIRKPSRVADPTREYKEDPEYRAAREAAGHKGLFVPDANDKGVNLAEGRTAITAPKGKHVPGALSADAKVPANYHEGVRVIPYRFSTPARSPGQMVGGTPSGGRISSKDADDFFRDDPPKAPDVSTVRSDVQAAKKAKTKKASDKKAKKSAMKRGSRPEDREKCRECGRICNEAGECQHCIDLHADEPSIEELEGLWRNGPE
jgi:hypothetical protein